MRNRLGTNRRVRRHFTITEMMMVVAISMIILALAIAAWVNSDGSVQLHRAARLVNAELNLARSKAIAERKTMTVYFFWDGDTQYCGIFEDGKSPFKNDKPVAGEANLPLPAKVAVLGRDVNNNESSFRTSLNNTSSRAYVSFNAQGQIVKPYNITLDKDSNLRTIYLKPVTGKAAASKGYKVTVEPDPGYAVTINEFNGRTQTTYHEAND